MASVGAARGEDGEDPVNPNGQNGGWRAQAIALATLQDLGAEHVNQLHENFLSRRRGPLNQLGSNTDFLEWLGSGPID